MFSQLGDLDDERGGIGAIGGEQTVSSPQLRMYGYCFTKIQALKLDIQVSEETADERWRKRRLWT